MQYQKNECSAIDEKATTLMWQGNSTTNILYWRRIVQNIEMSWPTSLSCRKHRKQNSLLQLLMLPHGSGSAIAGMCASDIIVGSVECSWHEFCGTRLGRRRLPHAIWYVTEVAVSPSTRRQKIGSQLLEAIDVYAQNRCVETLYLHVDVANRGALRMYEKAGYLNLSSKSHDRYNNDDSMHLEFTKSLNLHPGATKGREHFLLYKNLVEESTWLDDSHVKDGTLDGSSHSSSRSNELVNGLGFDIPA